MSPPSGTRPTPRAARPYDVILWGATGFTGALVAEYLARHYAGTLRWALAGRSKEKLEKVRADIAAVDPRTAALPLLLGDSADRPSLDALARDARVVVSTVGPYSRHGADLVAACVDAGTDYCDLTGEAQFMRRMIDAHHARAGQTGARIVHACGFDSIPSDLGTLFVQNAMRERHGRPASEVRCIQRASGSFSGGTFASMLLGIEETLSDRDARRVMADPHSLDPGHSPGEAHERGARREGDQLGVRWDPDLGRWTGPFVLAASNARVVRRTNALLGYAYGKDFRYHEALDAGTGASGWLLGAGVAVGTVGFFTAAAVRPVRWLLANSVLPKPGEGPSKEARERGHFTTRFVALAGASGGERPATVFGTVRGTQDPGYGETAKMISEAAVCLAVDESVPGQGGVLTPAACMGMRLVERLRAAGMPFETNETA